MRVFHGRLRPGLIGTLDVPRKSDLSLLNGEFREIVSGGIGAREQEPQRHEDTK
jgi:hypothetical protein